MMHIHSIEANRKANAESIEGRRTNGTGTSPTITSNLICSSRPEGPTASSPLPDGLIEKDQASTTADFALLADFSVANLVAKPAPSPRQREARSR